MTGRRRARRCSADAGFGPAVTARDGRGPADRHRSGCPRWVAACRRRSVGARSSLLPLVAMLAARRLGATSRPLDHLASRRAAALLARACGRRWPRTALCIVLGVPLALVLARVALPRARRAALAGAAAAGAAAGRRRHRAALHVRPARPARPTRSRSLGIQIAFSTTAVVLAQTFVALPFLVVSLEGALRTAGERYEAVAATLGAAPDDRPAPGHPPLVLPGLVSGAVLSFARALGEFGATITFAGSLQGVTRTLPLEIYLQRETDPDAAVALSLVLVVVAVLVDRAAPDGGRGARRDPPPSRRALAEPRRRRRAATSPTARCVAVLGPNGAGQVDAARRARRAAPARPPAGRARRAGAASTRRRDLMVPPHARGVALLAQDAAAVPAPDRPATTSRSGRAAPVAPRATARRAPERWLAEVDAAELADRARPRSSPAARRSGSRSPARSPPSPRLLLLDEPLAALDVAVAPALRQAAAPGRWPGAPRSCSSPTTCSTPLLLADRVVVLEDGRVVEEGPTQRGAAPAPQPLRGPDRRAQPGARTPARHAPWPPRPGLVVEGRVEEPEVGSGDAVAVFRPSAVAVFPEPPGGSPRNVLDVTVTELEPLGDRVRVRTREQVSADVTAVGRRRPRAGPGPAGVLRGQGERGRRLPGVARLRPDAGTNCPASTRPGSPTLTPWRLRSRRGWPATNAAGCAATCWPA